MSAKNIYDKLLKTIGNPYGVCGLMGNLQAESGLKANNLQDTGNKSLGMTDEQYTDAVDKWKYTNFVNDSIGYGLAQWTFWTRKEKLLKFAEAYGSSIGDEDMQVAFIVSELIASFPVVLKVLKNAKSVREASDVVLTQYESPADQSNSVKELRASYGEKFYIELFCTKEMKKETKKSKTRDSVVVLIKSWEGKTEANGGHKEIIDIYNDYTGALPRGIKMTYDWAWCAATWSALAIKLGYTAIMPIEISCYYIVEKAKEMGIWVENDAYVPNPADAVLYDWDDDGAGDNTGVPDHIGTVISVDKNAGTFTVIEGNNSGAVKRRTMQINGKYIRGFITPKYDDAVKSNADASAVITPKKSVAAKYYAQEFNMDIAGDYKASTDVYMKHNAGAKYDPIVVIPEGTECCCYGYYSTDPATGRRWYYSVVCIGDTMYTGFVSSKYLSI